MPEKIVTYEELKAHDTKDSLWLLVSGKGRQSANYQTLVESVDNAYSLRHYKIHRRGGYCRQRGFLSSRLNHSIKHPGGDEVLFAEAGGLTTRLRK